MSAFNAGKQRLTPAEERVVVDFCRSRLPSHTCIGTPSRRKQRSSVSRTKETTNVLPRRKQRTRWYVSYMSRVNLIENERTLSV